MVEMHAETNEKPALLLPKWHADDPYVKAASAIFSVPRHEVTKEQRKHAKSALFYYMYPTNPRSNTDAYLPF